MENRVEPSKLPPPRIRAKKTTFKEFLYDPKEKSVCGRSCQSWVLIILFYIGFYLVLAGLFASCFMVFYLKIVPADYPIHHYPYNFFAQPGMTFLPQDKTTPHFTSQVYQILTIDPSDPASYAEYVTQLRDIMKDYESEESRTVKSCQLVDQAESCNLNPNQFEPNCWNSTDPTNFKFGYDVGEPCLLFRLNKLFNWVPEEIPLGGAISEVGSRREAGKLPVACKSFRPKSSDVDTDLGTMDFYPSGGFPVSCYPFCSRRTEYKSPLVMVKFSGLPRNTLISIECSFYAANVIIDRSSGTGSAAFQIFIKA